MIIGVPTEIKTREYRVAMIPAGAKILVDKGHPVLIQQGAGLGSGITDEEYARAGAEIVAGAAEVWKRSDMIVKVKEPLPDEFPLLREGQILFTYLHLAAAPEIATRAAQAQGRRRRLRDHRDPRPPPAAAHAHERGRRPHGHPGGRHVPREGARRQGASCWAACPACGADSVAILGGGVVGLERRARSPWAWARRSRCSTSTSRRLSYLDDIYQGRIHTLYSDPVTVEEAVHARRPRGRRGAGRRRARAAPGHARDGLAHAAGHGAGGRRRRSGRLRWRPAARRPTTTRPTWSTASCTTAWPTCRAPSRAHPPTPWSTPPSATPRRSPTWGSSRRPRLTLD